MTRHDCDGTGIHTAGELRRLPICAASGELIVCRGCFNSAVNWRKQMNKNLPDGSKYEIQKWEDLEICEED